MGETRSLTGRVQSIASGITDRDRSTGTNLLPNVNPAFNWVRLTQRIPVRVEIVDVPQALRLVAGQTATVAVRAAGTHAEGFGRSKGSPAVAKATDGAPSVATAT